MFIQHNMEASMANRCLDLNQKNLKVSSQRLASGYRINSAADDAVMRYAPNYTVNLVAPGNTSEDEIGEFQSKRSLAIHQVFQ